MEVKVSEIVLKDGDYVVYYHGKKISTQHTELKASKKLAAYIKGRS